MIPLWAGFRLFFCKKNFIQYFLSIILRQTDNVVYKLDIHWSEKSLQDFILVDKDLCIMCFYTEHIV